MTKGEQDLLNALNSNVDDFDDYFSADSANKPILARKTLQSAAGSLGRQPGNPTFSSQFDLEIKTLFASQDFATGLVWAKVLPAALLIAAPALATKLTAFLFGFSDFTAGFANSDASLPLTGGWRIDGVVVEGKDVHIEDMYGSNYFAAVQHLFKKGDLILHFIGGHIGASIYHAYVYVRCSQGSYATLLNAMASDRFVINNIRYILADTSAVGLAQYANNIALLKLTLFGQTSKDFVSPNSFKQPQNFQNGIIDVPLKKGLNKENTLATYINYDVQDIQWSIFVWTTNKLK